MHVINSELFVVRFFIHHFACVILFAVCCERESIAQHHQSIFIVQISELKSTEKMASVFADVEVGPKIEVFALTKAFQEDPSMVKVNLSVGGKLFTSNGSHAPFIHSVFFSLRLRQIQVRLCEFRRNVISFVQLCAQFPCNQLVTQLFRT